MSEKKVLFNQLKKLVKKEIRLDLENLVSSSSSFIVVI